MSAEEEKPKATSFEDASPEEQLEYKREYAIRQREQEMKRKQTEELEKKQQQFLQKKREEEKAKEQRQMEVQQGYSKAQMQKKTQAMENEYRDRCREAQITKKRNAWLTRENNKIFDMIEESLAAEDELNERKLEAKERKNQKIREDQEKRGFYAHAAKAREQKRENAEREAAEARKERAIKRIDELKAALDDEIDAYMEHPTHIPLKQALCGGLRPVPTVTTLLAALRDQEEDLADLKKTNLEERTKALGKPLFTFVQELKEGHEKSRLRPPEPEIDEKRARKKILPTQ